MDMSMDSPMLLANGQMLPFLHVVGADTLWLQGWVLHSPASTAGACIGVFLLAILSRWLDAVRSLADMHWASVAHTHATALARGCLQGAQSLLAFAFMLALM